MLLPGACCVGLQSVQHVGLVNTSPADQADNL